MEESLEPIFLKSLSWRMSNAWTRQVPTDSLGNGWRERLAAVLRCHPVTKSFHYNLLVCSLDAWISCNMFLFTAICPCKKNSTWDIPQPEPRLAAERWFGLVERAGRYLMLGSVLYVFLGGARICCGFKRPTLVDISSTRVWILEWHIFINWPIFSFEHIIFFKHTTAWCASLRTADEASSIFQAGQTILRAHKLLTTIHIRRGVFWKKSSESGMCFFK